MQNAFAAFRVLAVLLIGLWPVQAAELLKIVKSDGTVASVTDADIEAIGQIRLTTQLVGADRAEHEVRGVRVRDLMAHYGSSGSSVDVVALDAYRMEIPMQDFIDYDVILATEVDGKRLSVRDRGPTWIVYPLKDKPELNDPIHEGRSVWQVKEIVVK